MKIKNKKNAFVLFGSPHEDGYSYKLLNSFLEGLNYDVRIIKAYKENILPCIDCDICRKSDSCAFDDFYEIEECIREADIIIIASPIYNLSFPSPLKAIIDRTQIFFSGRFFRNEVPAIKKAKKGVALLTCGRDKELSVDIVLRQINQMFSIMNTKLKFSFVIDNTDKEDVDLSVLEDAYNTALNIDGI